MGQFPNLSPFLVSPCVREPVSVQTALHNIPRAQFPEIPLVGWFSINQCRAHVRGNRWCFQVASDSLQWTVLDLWSPKEKFSLWDQRLSFSHSELCMAKVLLQCKNDTLATTCEGLTHWKRLWCWEELGAGGERDDRGWDGWMASLTQWTWV